MPHRAADALLKTANAVGLAIGVPFVLLERFKRARPDKNADDRIFGHEDPEAEFLMAKATDAVEKAAKVLKYKTPDVSVYASGIEGAEASRLPLRNGRVTFTSSMIRNSSEAELLGVAAHEVAHLKNHDTGLMNLQKAGYAGVVGASAIAGVPVFSEIVSNLHFVPVNTVFDAVSNYATFLTSLPSIAAAPTATLFAGAVTVTASTFKMKREAEKRADRDAARAVGPDGLLSRLQRMQPEPPHQRTLFGLTKVANEIEANVDQAWSQVTRTHPDLSARFEQLEAIQKPERDIGPSL